MVGSQRNLDKADLPNFGDTPDPSVVEKKLLIGGASFPNSNTLDGGEDPSLFTMPGSQDQSPKGNVFIRN
jgi:hypothetical protein